jgi:N-acyl-D-aspartate/D-glutamate deacylase
MEALAKMTILPAKRLEGASPTMRRRGRVQVGANADLAVFDPEEVIDVSTYARPDAPSKGMQYVLVGGSIVVRDGRIVEGVFPGKSIR